MILKNGKDILRRKLNMDKYVYLFSEGNSNMRELLGGKGANLAEMTNLRFACTTRLYNNN
jgi:phosphoenolpyruvate synthase/pyruvate phosphate dikinase